jgi:hypothetical protein
MRRAPLSTITSPWAITIRLARGTRAGRGVTVF